MASLGLRAVGLLACGALAAAARAQVAEGVIRGRVLDGLHGQGVPGEKITLESAANPEFTPFRCTDVDGTFAFAALPPGSYRLTARYYGGARCDGAAASGAPEDRFKWREIDALELPVAGRIELEILVWPMQDAFSGRVYEGLVLPRIRTLLRPYGPDLDTSRTENFDPIPTDENLLDSSLSSVFSPLLVRDLPLAGRDIYNTVVLQPGASAETGAVRGVGISIVGQRPGSANFMLDGVENNSYLTSGPLMPAAPESVQEYRFSTNGFSAEFGRAAGVVANVVTRSGTDKLHALLYLYGKHDLLSANDPQHKRQGEARTPLRELQAGLTLSGRLLPRRAVFGSVAYERLRFRTVGAYEQYFLPSVAARTRAGSLAAGLLDGSGLLPFSGADPLKPVEVLLEPRASLNRTLLLPRLDFLGPGDRTRLSARLLVSRLDRPDLEWSPYASDSVPFRESTSGLALSAVTNVSPALTLTGRASFDLHRYSVEPPRTGVPFFPPATDGTLLPGSQLGYFFNNRVATLQLSGGAALFRGPHFARFGGDVTSRRVSGQLLVRPSGYFSFDTLADFLADKPSMAILGFNCPGLAFTSSEVGQCRTGSREGSSLVRRVWDASLYAQDTIRLRANLVVHGGVRLDSLGGPGAVGAPVLGYSGPPDSLAAVAASQPVASPVPRVTSLAARAGVAWAWGPERKYLFRAGYGGFRDRIFENDWIGFRRNAEVDWLYFSGAGDIYQRPGKPPPPGAIRLQNLDLATAGGLRPGKAHNGFAAVHAVVSSHWSTELTGQFSLGRSLASSNLINRLNAVDTLPELLLRANQDESDYTALSAVLRYRSPRAQLQLAYTWSHTLDHQTDALEGLLAEIFPNPRATAGASPGLPQYAVQFDRDRDWGNSDFDQRHAVLFYGSWALPSAPDGLARRLTGSWRMAAVAAARSGFPFSVYGAANPLTGSPGIRNRASLIGPATGYRISAPAPDGRIRLLDPARFATPDMSPGNLGRNSLGGPGVVSADISLSRQWRHFLFRADVFNVLNHFNLNRPVNAALDEDFGLAAYGRRGRDTGFPALLPFVETPRQFQMMLRYEF